MNAKIKELAKLKEALIHLKTALDILEEADYYDENLVDATISLEIKAIEPLEEEIEKGTA